MDLREPTAQPVREANADQSVPLAQREHADHKVNADPPVPLALREHADLKVNVDPPVPLVRRARVERRALRVLEDPSV